MHVRRVLPVAAVLSAALVAPGPAHAAPGDNTRISNPATGAESTGLSDDPSLSSTGRYVAFTSQGALTPPDGPTSDVYWRDNQLGDSSLVRVSNAFSSGEANNNSVEPAITGDGTHVAFESAATDLLSAVPELNGVNDVYLASGFGGLLGITLMSGAFPTGESNGASASPAGDFDGEYIAFESDATNLASDLDMNACRDIFVRNATAGTTRRVSVDSLGSEQDCTGGLLGAFYAGISGDGRFAVFQTDANLNGADTNGLFDVYVHDRDVGGDGTLDEPGDIETLLVSAPEAGGLGNGASQFPVISSDGGWIAFQSDASNLVAGDTNGAIDVFVRLTTATGPVGLMSVATTDQHTDAGGSKLPAISADGRFVTFQSEAADLVPGDSNMVEDVFVHDRDSDENGMYDDVFQTGTIRLSTDGVVEVPDDDPNAFSTTGAVARAGPDAAWGVFGSNASDIVPGDTNGVTDVFRRELGGPPGAPANVTALAGNGSATISWTPPTATGGTAITEYLVRVNETGAVLRVPATQTSMIVSGLSNGTIHTFSVRAANAVWPGPRSAPSASVTPTSALVPSAPTAVTAAGGNRAATVTWGPAAANGAAITGYTVTANPGGASVSVHGAARTATLTGLPEGTYTFEVRATNAIGTGPPATSNTVPVVELTSFPLCTEPTLHTAPFGDIDGSFAEDEIACLYDAGIVAGTSATTYSPTVVVTREQMAVFIVNAYEYAIADQYPQVTTNPFTDVDTSFARLWILQLVDLGITAGCSTGAPQYCPSAMVTREQMAVFLVRLHEALLGHSPPAPTAPFTDIAGSFAADEIAQLVGLGVTSGTSASTFSPTAPVTREQMAVFITRALETVTA